VSRYRLTPEAQANVDEICGFIAADSVDVALRVLDAFEHAFDQLSATPEIGHRREDLTRRPVKLWSVYSSCTIRRVLRWRSSLYCTARATSSDS